MTGTQNAVQCNGDSASFRDVLHVLADDPAFRDQFNDWVASSSFDTFRWETPPVTSDLIDRPFEFVVINNPGLGERPDPTPAHSANNLPVHRNHRSICSTTLAVTPCWWYPHPLPTIIITSTSGHLYERHPTNNVINCGSRLPKACSCRWALNQRG